MTGVWGAVKGLMYVVPWLFSFATTAEVRRRFVFHVDFYCGFHVVFLIGRVGQPFAEVFVARKLAFSLFLGGES